MRFFKNKFTLWNKKYQKKLYGHIISLGYNCEIAFQLYRFNGFLESNLFAWSYSKSLHDIIYALEHLDEIGCNGFNLPSPLYECLKTHIYFHGKSSIDPISKISDAELQADINELYNRIVFLKEKFKKTACDGEKNLYILKIRSSETDLIKKLNHLLSVLKQIVQNDFNILLIIEADLFKNFEDQLNNESYFIRKLNNFTDDNQVTNINLADIKGWNKILSEFRPLHKLSKTKRFKFEEL